MAYEGKCNCHSRCCQTPWYSCTFYGFKGQRPLAGRGRQPRPVSWRLRQLVLGYCLTLLQRKNESIYAYPVKRKLKKRKGGFFEINKT